MYCAALVSGYSISVSVVSISVSFFVQFVEFEAKGTSPTFEQRSDGPSQVTATVYSHLGFPIGQLYTTSE